MDSNFKEENYNNVDKKDLKKEYSKIEQVVNPKNSSVKLKQNLKREQIFYKGYGKDLRRTQILYNISTKKFKKEASQIYNIQALQQ